MPGGYFVLNDYDENDPDKITQLAGYLNYPRQARREALQNAGLEIVRD